MFASVTKILFKANDLAQSFDVAIAFTTKIQELLYVWLTLFQLFTTCLFQSQKSHSTLTIFQLVNGWNLTLVGKPALIASTLIKKLNHPSQLPKGVWSKSFFHKDTTTRLLSSTIHTGLFFPSPSISSSHTFPIQSSSKSYWFLLNIYGQLSCPLVIQSQS